MMGNLNEITHAAIVDYQQQLDERRHQEVLAAMQAKEQDNPRL